MRTKKGKVFLQTELKTTYQKQFIIEIFIVVVLRYNFFAKWGSRRYSKLIFNFGAVRQNSEATLFSELHGHYNHLPRAKNFIGS